MLSDDESSKVKAEGSFTHLSHYTRFLIANYLDPFTERYIEIATVSIVERINDASPHSLHTIQGRLKNDLLEFLSSLSKEQGVVYIQAQVNKWARPEREYLSEGSAPQEVFVHDLLVVKKILYEFLDKFVLAMDSYKIVSLEIENFFSQLLLECFRFFETRQKQALQEGAHLTQTILDSALNGIVALKAIRNEDDKIVDFEYVSINNRGEVMLQRKRKDLIGKRLLDVFPATKGEGIFDQYVTTVETGIEKNKIQLPARRV